MTQEYKYERENREKEINKFIYERPISFPTYAISSLVIITLTFFLWYSVGGSYGISAAILAVVSVLVAVFPITLALAAPIALKIGQQVAASNHIYMSDVRALVALESIDTLLISKTGSLTYGEPYVVDSYWVKTDDGQSLDLFYSALNQAPHPLSATIAQWLSDSGATAIETGETEVFGSIGALTRIDGKSYWVGNGQMASNYAPVFPEAINRRLKRWYARGFQVAFYGVEDSLIAAVAIADRIRPDSRQAIKMFKNEGWDIHLVTVNSEPSVRNVAIDLDIENIMCNVNSEKKMKYIIALQRMGKKVALITASYDDASVASYADLDVRMDGTMPSPADRDSEATKIFLADNSLLQLYKSINISKRSLNTARHNQYFALATSAIAIIASTGLLFPINGILPNPLMSLGIMATGTFLMAVLSLRLKLIF
jgi:Cu2+-exporting ATPase